MTGTHHLPRQSTLPLAASRKCWNSVPHRAPFTRPNSYLVTKGSDQMGESLRSTEEKGRNGEGGLQVHLSSIYALAIRSVVLRLTTSPTA